MEGSFGHVELGMALCGMSSLGLNYHQGLDPKQKWISPATSGGRKVRGQSRYDEEGSRLLIEGLVCVVEGYMSFCTSSYVSGC